LIGRPQGSDRTVFGYRSSDVLLFIKIAYATDYLQEGAYERKRYTYAALLMALLERDGWKVQYHVCILGAFGAVSNANRTLFIDGEDHE
jgi:hypothetical protein